MMETSVGETLSTLLVVPARGGSKGLPGKNKRNLLGRPLSWWTLSFCQELGAGPCVLSSDDDDILELASQFESCLPIRRPSDLASDTAGDQEVLLHALTAAEIAFGQTFQRVVMLQPTSPGRRVGDVHVALRAHASMKDPSNSSVWGAHQVPDKYHYLKQISLVDGVSSISRITRLPPRRQDLPPSFIRSGDFYVIGRDALADPYLMGHEMRIIELVGELLNIDTLEDFSKAEMTLHPRGDLLERRGEAE